MRISASRSLVACLQLASLIIVGPSHQFSLGHKRQPTGPGRGVGESRQGARHGKDSTSVRVKLATSDSADSPVHRRHTFRAGLPSQDPRLPASRRRQALLLLRAQKTNTETSSASHQQQRKQKQQRQRGAELTETGPGRRRKLIGRKESPHSQANRTRPRSDRRQVSSSGGGTPLISNTEHPSPSPPPPDSYGPNVHFVEVVEVAVAAPSHQHTQQAASGIGDGGGGGGSAWPVYEAAWKSSSSSSIGRDAEDPEAAVRLGQAEALQQEVRRGGEGDAHAPSMVLTALGSLTALCGVCVMAAIFQCCCRKKRAGGSGQENHGGPKDGHKGQAGDSKRSRSRSKSPSPHKVPEIREEGADRRQNDRDKLIEDDEDLGDFSVVQRETEILRSYRKPPPPKNRARASRVPRALKTADPKVNPNVFKELVEQEENELQLAAEAKPADEVPDTSSQQTDALQSSMLADIDSTLAALHDDDDDGDNKLSESRKTPSKGSSSQSREPSVEKKVLAPETENGGISQPPPPDASDGEERAPLSREELAKSLALELSKSVGKGKKEGTEKPLSKSVSPQAQSRDSTPKSRSAGASPKLKGRGKEPLFPPKSSKSQEDSVTAAAAAAAAAAQNGKGGGEGGSDKSREGEEAEETRGPQNVFALIDPTAGGEAGQRDKSKIPVRASSSPTQPTAPLRSASGKDYKRFPVPSVHGDQMDQLMKSLKTRLKEDSPGVKKVSNKVSPEENAAEDGLQPQGRDRSHSDPNKQKEEKPEQQFHQTHL